MNATLQLKLLSDVDTTELNDGALLQYRPSDGKFVTRTEIVTTTERSCLIVTFKIKNGNYNSDKKEVPSSHLQH